MLMILALWNWRFDMISSNTCEVQEGRAPKNQEVLRQTLSICQAGTGQQIFHSFPRQVSHIDDSCFNSMDLFVRPTTFHRGIAVSSSIFPEAGWVPLWCQIHCHSASLLLRKLPDRSSAVNSMMLHLWFCWQRSPRWVCQKRVGPFARCIRDNWAQLLGVLKYLGFAGQVPACLRQDLRKNPEKFILWSWSMNRKHRPRHHYPFGWDAVVVPSEHCGASIKDESALDKFSLWERNFQMNLCKEMQRDDSVGTIHGLQPSGSMLNGWIAVCW